MRRSEPLSVQRAYVADQYSDADKLRIRIETHRLYSQGTESLTDDILDALALAPGLSLLDVGCGSGKWHARLAARGQLLACAPAWFPTIRPRSPANYKLS